MPPSQATDENASCTSTDLRASKSATSTSKGVVVQESHNKNKEDKRMAAIVQTMEEVVADEEREDLRRRDRLTLAKWTLRTSFILTRNLRIKQAYVGPDELELGRK